MTSVYETRRENVRRLMKLWGGPTTLAKKLGHSNGSYLSQIAGPHPRRDISERVAREIEQKLALRLGYLDQEHPDAPVQIDDRFIAEAVRAVAAEIRDAGLKPKPELFGKLVQLVYENAKTTGAIDEGFIRKLLELMK